MTAFRDKVAALRDEWNTMQAAAAAREDEETRAQRRNLGRLRKGLRTPESAYYVPILQALVELGGRGSPDEVLTRVEQLMKPVLKPVDYQPLASEELRWRNAARWARQAMVQKGLLKADSPEGIWEISDAGRQYLEQLKSQGSIPPSDKK